MRPHDLPRWPAANNRSGRRPSAQSVAQARRCEMRPPMVADPITEQRPSKSEMLEEVFGRKVPTAGMNTRDAGSADSHRPHHRAPMTAFPRSGQRACDDKAACCSAKVRQHPHARITSQDVDERRTVVPHALRSCGVPVKRLAGLRLNGDGLGHGLSLSQTIWPRWPSGIPFVCFASRQWTFDRDSGRERRNSQAHAAGRRARNVRSMRAAVFDRIRRRIAGQRAVQPFATALRIRTALRFPFAKGIPWTAPARAP